MPVQYPLGIIKEHQHTRSAAGLFDVSHMGQYVLHGAQAAVFLEHVTPSAFIKLPAGKCRYTMLTNAGGGCIDDCIITRLDDETFYLVLNAGCKEKDVAHMRGHLPDGCTLTPHANTALLALQGPQAEQVLQTVCEVDLSGLKKMHLLQTNINSAPCLVGRTGYTGEDGFEISTPDGTALWQALLKNSAVQPIGLGARDSLRLEAGFPLYGHDLDDTTSPVEAGLAWVLRKNRLESCLGGTVIAQQLANSAPRSRVGLKVTDKGIAREGTAIYKADKRIGTLTSGGFAPSLGCAIGMGYIQTGSAFPGDSVWLNVRGKKLAAQLTDTNFLTQRPAAA